MTVPDPLAEVRAEFAAGLALRIDTMRAALGALEAAFGIANAEALYRAAHSLAGTAGSFGAEGLAHVASDLESLARSWLARGQAAPEEWRIAKAAITELEAAAREYRATTPSGVLRAPAAPWPSWVSSHRSSMPPSTCARFSRARFSKSIACWTSDGRAWCS